jgi:hypothetical protein
MFGKSLVSQYSPPPTSLEQLEGPFRREFYGVHTVTPETPEEKEAKRKAAAEDRAAGQANNQKAHDLPKTPGVDPGKEKGAS